jgi:chromosomal replication initiation ATPase DnaA
VLFRLPPPSSYAACDNSSSLLYLVQKVVVDAAAVSLAELQAPTRGSAQVARARQRVMYLAHTVFGLRISAIARECNRHHSTVAYACRLVEEQRDDPAVDRTITALEEKLSARCHGLDS